MLVVVYDCDSRFVSFQLDRLSNTSLFVMIVSIVFVDIVVLLLWDFLDPAQVQIVKFPEEVKSIISWFSDK